MGDVRITAAATLVAALVAVGGSIVAVVLSGRSQRRLLDSELRGQAVERRAQWAEERRRARDAALVVACTQFDAAIVVALARLQRAVDLADRPGVRRQLLGSEWSQRWEADLQAALIDLALPYSALRFAAEPPLLAAADSVMDALRRVADSAAGVPGPLPPHPAAVLRRGAVQRWRQRIDEARDAVHCARRELVTAADVATARGSPTPRD